MRNFKTTCAFACINEGGQPFFAPPIFGHNTFLSWWVPWQSANYFLNSWNNNFLSWLHSKLKVVESFDRKSCLKIWLQFINEDFLNLIWVIIYKNLHAIIYSISNEGFILRRICSKILAYLKWLSEYEK